MILSFVSYLIPAENFGNRLSMNLTLFLTLAALNLSISKQLPSSSYPTIANKFIMVSFIVVALAVPECIAVHAITTRAAEKDSTNSVSPLLLGPLFKNFSRAPWKSTSRAWAALTSAQHAKRVAFAIDMVWLSLMVVVVIVSTLVILRPVIF